ncbi:MAG: YkgJ family cysteine cluster protein [Nanoarchaeota archaeon]|nr:YkgJ family cysteine cluster protein [Nanoarchaeota archaeon]
MEKGFRCKRCGECCKASPKLSDEDIRRILKLGIKKEYFVENINGKDYMMIKDNVCVFLGKKEGMYYCKIYGARPEICRMYPNGNFENCQPEKFAFDEYLKRKNG